MSTRKGRVSILGRPTPEVIKHFAPDGCYKETKTNFTTRIETESDVIVFSDRFIGPGLLKLIVLTRAEVQANFAKDEIIPCQVSPQYSALGEVEKKSNAVEVDISKAYLTAAFKIGAISQRTFDRLSDCAKETRLMVIGSLATKKMVCQYEGGKRIGREWIQDQNLTQVWRWIVAEVDKTMREVAAELKKGFLYYWCDAVFVKAEFVRQAQEAMKAKGYGSKTRMVKIQHKGKSVYVMSDSKPNREFPTKEKIAL
jgi:hypothetical protein